jgi:iron(III) transport system permease protein
MKFAASYLQVLRIVVAVAGGIGGMWIVTLLQCDAIQARQQTTLLLALTVASLATPIGAYWATWLVRVQWPGRSMVIGMLLAMAVLPLYMQAAAWEAGFGKLGWYTVAQGSSQSPWLTSWRAAVWVYFVAALPWTTAVAFVGLDRLDRRLQDLSRLERGAIQTWWIVVFPRLTPTLILSFAFVAVVVATELTVADLYMIDTVARELYLGFAMGDTLAENWRASATMIAAWFLWCSLCVAICIYGWRGQSTISAAVPHGKTRMAAASRTVAITTVLTPLLILSTLPIGSLFLAAGRAVQNVDGVIERQWSLQILAQNLVTGFSEFRSEMFWTTSIGLVAATATVALACFLVRIARCNRYSACLVLCFNGFLMVIPGPLLGLTLVSIFNTPALPWLHELYDHSIAAPVVVGVLRGLPIVTAVAYLLSKTIPRAILELSALDGLNHWQRWWRIQWPLTRRGIAVAWLLSLAMTMGEHSATFAVTPPGITTMAHRIFGLIHSGARQKQASLTLLGLGCFVVIAAMSWLVITGRKSGRARAPSET